MNKTTRKGIRLGIPNIIEGWYEQKIEGLKVNIKKKNADIVNAQFQNFLLITERDFEARLWSARAFLSCCFDKDVDFEFSLVMSNTIGIFNDMRQKLDASKLSEDLLNHLQHQIKSILITFKLLEDISGTENWQLKKDTIYALKAINERETDIWMEVMSYFKKTD